MSDSDRLHALADEDPVAVKIRVQRFLENVLAPVCCSSALTPDLPPTVEGLQTAVEEHCLAFLLLARPRFESGDAHYEGSHFWEELTARKLDRLNWPTRLINFAGTLDKFVASVNRSVNNPLKCWMADNPSLGIATRRGGRPVRGVGWTIFADAELLEISAVRLLKLIRHVHRGRPRLLGIERVEACLPLAHPDSLRGRSWSGGDETHWTYPQELSVAARALEDVIVEAGQEFGVVEGSSSSSDGGTFESAHTTSPLVAAGSRRKALREPPAEAFVAYRAFIATGKKQLALAILISEELKRPVSQGQISRWLKDVRQWMERGNALPAVEVKARRPKTLPAAVIELGKRQDQTTKRQRLRRGSEAEAGE